MKSGTGFFDKVINRGTDIVDFATSLPEKIDNVERGVNDFLIDTAQKFKKGQSDAESIATKNLASNKIRTVASQVATWIQKPMNLAIAAGAVLAVVFLIRRS